MRTELAILRDIAGASRWILARYPFDEETSLAIAFHTLALLQAELIGLEDFEKSRQSTEQLMGRDDP